MTLRQLAAVSILICAPLLATAQSQEEPTVSYRVVLENQLTHERALDEKGVEVFGFPWAFSGQVFCDATFPCAPGVQRVTWKGQGLTQASGLGEAPVVRIQLTLTEHSSGGNRVRNVSWEGAANTVYEDRLLGKWFLLRAASRLEP